MKQKDYKLYVILPISQCLLVIGFRNNHCRDLNQIVEGVVIITIITMMVVLRRLVHLEVMMMGMVTLKVIIGGAEEEEVFKNLSPWATTPQPLLLLQGNMAVLCTVLLPVTLLVQLIIDLRIDLV
jgi:hypothetical protein